MARWCLCVVVVVGVGVFPPFLTANLNLPAISHHKSSRQFSPQIFPPFLTTNLPAISHHKSTKQQSNIFCIMFIALVSMAHAWCLR
jgi:hypothetical protein